MPGSAACRRGESRGATSRTVPRAPLYSLSRSPRSSSPAGVWSPADPARRPAPQSTLMPVTMPCLASRSGKEMPVALCWRMVSSWRMTPLTMSDPPGLERSSSHEARRLSGVESIACAASRLVRAATVSSAARMPFPPATSARAVTSSSCRDIHPPFGASTINDPLKMWRRSGRVLIAVVPRAGPVNAAVRDSDLPARPVPPRPAERWSPAGRSRPSSVCPPAFSQ